MSDYPNSPGYKTEGTSEQAAGEMKETAKTLRAKVLAAMNEIRQVTKTGWTADEMAKFLGYSILSIRPRFSELLKQEQIEDSGLRRSNESGKSAVVWRIKEKPKPEQYNFL